jgi:N-acetylglucosaminyldiphosphoundecaprenol N-acetyl-beta-D-mannosaminyltransferase
MSEFEKRRRVIGGIQLSAEGLQGALRELDVLLADGNHHYVCFCESNLFVHARRSPELLEVLNRASMVLPDGIALVWEAKLLGRPLTERVPGPTFFLAACKHGVAKGYRHFFYGGAEGVAERLAEVLARRYPGIEVVGYYSPPFRPLTDKEEEEIKHKIESARPHLLWVGLGGPKQEFWMAQHVGKINVPVMLAVGAAFDFHSCTVPWAPKWVRKIGMEWIYRAMTGGRRVLLRNIWCVSLAAALIVHDVLRERNNRGRLSS